MQNAIQNLTIPEQLNQQQSEKEHNLHEKTSIPLHLAVSWWNFRCHFCLDMKPNQIKCKIHTSGVTISVNVSKVYTPSCSSDRSAWQWCAPFLPPAVERWPEVCAPPPSPQCHPLLYHLHFQRCHSTPPHPDALETHVHKHIDLYGHTGTYLSNVWDTSHLYCNE